jgi:uncharacterized protein YcbK (DUF882 family)
MTEKIFLSELRCPCCGEIIIDDAFLARLRLAREIAGVPFVITSGYRCEKHNEEIGSSSRNHVEGKAADIRATNGPARGKILKGLYKAGFERVGIRKDFIHCDTMEAVESCWLY